MFVKVLLLTNGTYARESVVAGKYACAIILYLSCSYLLWLQLALHEGHVNPDNHVNPVKHADRVKAGKGHFYRITGLAWIYMILRNDVSPLNLI
jgi:hypothetical protein